LLNLFRQGRNFGLALLELLRFVAESGRLRGIMSFLQCSLFSRQVFQELPNAGGNFAFRLVGGVGQIGDESLHLFALLRERAQRRRLTTTL
jgi:hypothetical protein